jgi:hypothetical protein
LSNHILLPNGDTIREDELYHFKYIKREKVGDKWKYYYDTEALKSDVKTAVSDPLGNKRKAALDQAQRKYQDATNRVSSRLMSDIHYREAANKNTKTSASEQANRDDAIRDYRRDNMNKIKAKEELDKARTEYDKSLRARVEKAPDALRGMAEGAKQKVQDILGKDERNYRDFAKRQSEAVDKTTMIVNGQEVVTDWDDEYARAEKEYMKTPLGVLEKTGKTINTAKDYVKDKLGFDEKEAAEKASAKANDSSVRAAHEIRNYNQAKKTESETKGLISKHKARQETETARVQAARASRQAGKDRADAAAAREAYANTPIGKVEKAAEKGKEWLKKLIGGKR